MRKITRLLTAVPLALFASIGLRATPAHAAEPIDNDELVADAEFQGLPDKDSHSGVFLDQIAVGSSSVTTPDTFLILASASSPTLRIAIFDGNEGGLWDQNLIENDANGLPVPDGSVAEYDLVTSSPDFPETVVALGDSETNAPRAGAKIFHNSVDGRWEFLYEGAQHPNAKIASGEYVYRLTVHFRQPTPSGSGIAPINGYKVAINAPFGLAPFQFGQTVVGGFIGGVVDSRNLRFAFPGAPPEGNEYSVSRDHYPDLLEPSATLNALLLNGPTFQPAVRFPAADPFVNRYDGTFELRIRLLPSQGQTWAEFVNALVLEEGDADDRDDVSGIGPDGLPSPVNPGIPPDDGGPYVDLNGVSHDNTGYRLPIAAAPQANGSPMLQVFDPDGVLRETLTDLSGNVSPEDSTGANFEKIPLPLDGKPGIWTLRMQNLDARNSWFVRTNATFVPKTQSLSGRVYCDLNCDGDDENGTDPALSGVHVLVLRTDVVGAPALDVVTNADGRWTIDPIPAGTYAVSVAPGQAAALHDKVPGTPQPRTATVASGQVVTGVDLGYCEPPKCTCGESGRLHQICFEASVWVASPCNQDLDLYVRLDTGCDCDPPMIDLSCFSFSGAFPGEQKGQNGLLTVRDVKVVDGYAKVLVCVDANAPWFPLGYFKGGLKLTVVVNGVGEAACGEFSCRTLPVGATFPWDWKPLWCGDVPDFHVASWLAWDCWDGKPCTDGCTKPLSWWKVVNKYGACDATRVAWPVDGGEDAVLCDSTWLKILRKSARCDAWVNLAQQWIVATLNARAGACVPKGIADAMAEAKALLEQNCGGLCGIPAGRGDVLSGILKSYNDGKAGPPSCNVKPPCCPPPPPPCKPTCDKPDAPKCDKPDAPKCDKPDTPPCDPPGSKKKGNNGVGNGVDPQPPGNPPVNDGPGTGPGSPGNRGGSGGKGK